MVHYDSRYCFPMLACRYVITDLGYRLLEKHLGEKNVATVSGTASAVGGRYTYKLLNMPVAH